MPEGHHAPTTSPVFRENLVPRTGSWMVVASTLPKERGWLTGALVAEGEDGARGVDGNADGKAAGDAGGGGARGGELVHGDAGDVLELGGELAGLKSSVGPSVGLYRYRRVGGANAKNETRHVRKIAAGKNKFISIIIHSIGSYHLSQTNASNLRTGGRKQQRWR